MFVSGVGMSSGASVEHAVQGAVAAAREKIGAASPTAAIVFASSRFPQEDVVESVRTQLGNEVSVVGGSTAGEISNQGPSTAPSVVVMLLASDTITMKAVSVSDAGNDTEARGKNLVTQAAEAVGGEPAFMLMVADGLTVNPSALLRGISTTYPNLPVAGGSAGDDGAFRQTFQYQNDSVLTSGVAAMAFKGPLKFSIGVRHGWSPISSFKTITRSEGNIIHEIDGKPAISLYEEYFGEEKAAGLRDTVLGQIALSYPLGVRDAESGTMLLRAPFSVDANGAITFGGEIPEGAEVQLMIGTKENAVEAAKESAAAAMKELGTNPVAAIIFSCHVRDTLFASKEQSKKEVDAIQSVIGAGVPLAGFYTYAEQAPIRDANVDIKTCNNLTHNETLVTVLLGE